MLLRLVKIYALLPLSWVRSGGRLFGWLIYALDGRYRKFLVRHMAMAGLTDPKLRKAAIAGVGSCLAEAPWLWGHTPEQLRDMVVCEQPDLLRELGSGKYPVLFMTPHLGTFEVLLRYISNFGKLTALYREPQMTRLRPFMASVREGGNMRAAPANLRGVRSMLKALRAGEAVGILPDQVPGAGEGQWVPFFGKSAYTMVLPQKLAEATRARIILTVGIPLANSSAGAPRWNMYMEEMTEVPSPENINKRCEQLILRMPHLYLWGYNRYKHPAGAPLPPGGLEAHRGDDV